MSYSLAIERPLLYRSTSPIPRFYQCFHSVRYVLSSMSNGMGTKSLLRSYSSYVYVTAY
jgi:hypothetical protein